MNSTARLALLFIGLLALVILASLYYARVTQGSPEAASESVTSGESHPPEPLTLPVDAHPSLLAGLESIKAQELKTAREQLQQVPASDSGYLVALANLAGVHLQLGDLQASLEALQAYAEIRHEDPQAHINLSWGYFRLGRYEEAEMSSLRALEIDPGNLAARFNVGLFRVAQARLPEAIRAYERAMNQPAFDGYLRNAREHLASLQLSRPDLPDVFYAMAYFSHRLGENEGELRQLERYLSMAPQGPAVEIARQRLEEARRAVGAD